MFLSEKFFMQAELRNGNIRPLQFKCQTNIFNVKCVPGSEKN